MSGTDGMDKMKSSASNNGRTNRSTRGNDSSSSPKGNPDSGRYSSQLHGGARSNPNRSPASGDSVNLQPTTAMNTPNDSTGGKGGKGDDDPTKGRDGHAQHMNADGSPKKQGGSSPQPSSQGESEGGQGVKDGGGNDANQKDSLKDKAKDKALNAVPGVGQANSARNVMDKVRGKDKDKGNGNKNDGGGDDRDDLKEVANLGKKGAKLTGQAAANAPQALLMMGKMMLIKMLGMLKTAILAAVQSVIGFFSSIIQAIAGFISAVLGVAASVANAIAIMFVGLFTIVAGAFGYAVVEEAVVKDDGAQLACVPTRTSVTDSSQSYIIEGEHDLIREENAVKLWSVYHELGGSKEQTAAVLGNLHHESSGLDPTATETIYDEPFQMGPRKLDAMAKDYKVDLIAPEYGARFPAIKYIGIGLAQWTNERNRLLIDYAEEQGVNWYEFDTQVRFMLEGDYDYRQDQLLDFLQEGSPSNVDAETERFMNTWIGLSSPNPSLSVRQDYARGYMLTLERATVDTDYANSILSGINVNRSAGNNAAGAYHQDDGCGNAIISHYGNQAIDGTGEIPADIELVPWSRETLPEFFRDYAKNPEDVGMTWGSPQGWETGGVQIIPDQCVALAVSYFMAIYPDWDKEGRPTTRAAGNGKDQADNWANHYGESVSRVPQAGAIFSDSTTSEYGHTGIVQHVFANGDILVIEQNITGVSGRNAPGLSYSWSWRAIKKERYEREGWKFFKPSQYDPQWVRNG